MTMLKLSYRNLPHCRLVNRPPANTPQPVNYLAKYLGVQLASIMLLLNSTSVLALYNPWAEVEAPSDGPPQIIGTYSAGCLQGAISLLPDEGPFVLMRPSRHHYYGHPQIRAFILWLAQSVQQGGYGKLLVGDISQPRGGPNTSGHLSHQIGIDADFWFWLNSETTHGPLSAHDKEYYSAPSMLNASQTAIDRNHFTDAQIGVLKMVAEHPQVARIFVNPLIKQDLCIRTNEASWLYKVRPWGGHHYHFHVRLTCPPGDSTCKPQEPPEKTTGCGAELDSWFAPPKTRPRVRTQAQKLAAALARVPRACQAILHAKP